MFGGYGLYLNGAIFGFIIDGELYFKVGELNRAEYERRGSRQFVYQRKTGKKSAMSYWTVPDEILEDRAQLAAWAQTSAEISQTK